MSSVAAEGTRALAGEVRGMGFEATVGAGGAVSTMWPQLPQTKSSGARRAPQWRQFIESSRQSFQKPGSSTAKGETRFLVLVRAALYLPSAGLSSFPWVSD
jgi:hypothetical protein